MPRPTYDDNAGIQAFWPPLSVTPGAGANLALALAVNDDAGPTAPPDVLWDGTTMTSVATAGESTSRALRLARFAPPGTGAKAVTQAGGINLLAGLTLSGVHATTPIAAAGAGADGVSAVIDIAQACGADDLIVGGLFWSSNAVLTPGGNTTIRASGSDGSGIAIFTSTGDIDITLDAATFWVAVWAVIAGAAAAPTDPPNTSKLFIPQG